MTTCIFRSVAIRRNLLSGEEAAAGPIGTLGPIYQTTCPPTHLHSNVQVTPAFRFKSGVWEGRRSYAARSCLFVSSWLHSVFGNSFAHSGYATQEAGIWTVVSTSLYTTVFFGLGNIWLRKCVFLMNNKPYFEEYFYVWDTSCRVWGAMLSAMDGKGYVLLSARNTALSRCFTVSSLTQPIVSSSCTVVKNSLFWVVVT
jgi:hypothetical protein